MRSPVEFSACARAGVLGKRAVLALAVVLAAGGNGRGQTAAANEPAGAAPPAAENALETYGPLKPEVNAAIRAALTGAALQNLSAEQRAVLRAVDAFYAENGDAPVFFDAGGWTAQARGVFDRLRRAPEDGLDLRAWRIFSLDAAPTPALAAGEVALAQAVAAYAFQASGGRIEPARISKLIGLRPDVVSAAKALEETFQAADAGAQLASYNPQQPGYRALREKLASLRESPGSLLLASQESPRESKRRASDARSPVAAAVSKAAQEASLLANMEMWRWMPRDLGTDRIMVNVPEFAARLYRGETLVATNKIVVGKPETPTPLFSNRVEYVVVNPAWYVPQSIIKKEMMGRSLNGYDVVWENGLMHVRQPPGERNALGRLKFIFPNSYSVYMHDTPARHLFATARRAYSHGCMRVDQPLAWAVALLGPQNGWTEKRIEKMYGKSERRVNLPAPLPIHIGYFTEEVDENGQIHAFDDVYGYAAEVKKRLGLGG
ncbi:murein L,D-transpeptidase YcbB/YkuD [Rhodoblastus sphagnicola]|nr:L,D-transpeptidase family protein [Rhodoblastus sphagnicola]MBB4196911.1 murein L,D-transpeptidase YcbB/YkuD [Rhodoblastus sphagnicola]